MVLLLRKGTQGRGRERQEGKWREGRVEEGRKGVGRLSSTKNSNADISQPEQIYKSSSKIVRFPKFIFYIIGLLQLTCKRVLSGSDCLKIDGGWGFAPDPTGKRKALLRLLTALLQTP